MTTVTLEEIKSAHANVAEMIAKFEAQAKESKAVLIPGQLIKLAPGEHYAGLITGKDGQKSYHLILLPGEAEEINWTDAQAWAKGQGGELPTRREQSLLYANLKDDFKEAWYWSGERHASYSDSAWGQGFSYGIQHYSLTCLRGRARSVRRLEIQ